MTTMEVTVADGRVESAGNGFVTGWAWIPATPEVRATIEVWVDGRIVASGVADQGGLGLEKVGIGDGHHGFTIALPEDLAGDRELAIAVRVAGVAQRLPMLNSWNLQEQDGAWADVRMVEDRKPPRPPMADDAPAIDAEPAAAALAGQSGWLFALPHGGDAVDKVAAALRQSAEELAALGIRYVVAIAPPKLAVYRDRLLHRGMPSTTAGRSLKRLARDSDVHEILDLHGVLADARHHGDVYLPRDEDWSALGALHVQRALVKRAGLPRLRPTPLAEARFAPRLELPAHALAELPIIGPAGDDAEPVIPDGVDASALQAQRVPAADHLEVDGLPAARVYERPGGDALPRVVLLGDPCIHAVVPWLAEVSSRLIIFSSSSPPMVPIELEFPDVVFHVLEERRIGAYAPTQT